MDDWPLTSYCLVAVEVNESDGDPDGVAESMDGRTLTRMSICWHRVVALALAHARVVY